MPPRQSSILRFLDNVGSREFWELISKIVIFSKTDGAFFSDICKDHFS